MKLTRADLEAAERELCRRSLAEFAKRAWRVLEPAAELKWGWALDAICLHLEAVTEGRITRLLMNVPPGSMKSLLTGVIWPAWEWGPRGMPEMRFVGTAHEETLAIRDSRRCRDLIKSEWYQSLWPVKLASDLDGKREFGNDKKGIRQARAFTSMTGVRGDRIILDDPISADNANSAAKLEAARIAFTETLPTRVNSDKSAIVVIMQRLNEADVSGVILSMGLPYVHLCIPMRFEPERRCVTAIGWSDPRTEEGELMFPERFGEIQVSELERTLGSGDQHQHALGARQIDAFEQRAGHGLLGGNARAVGAAGHGGAHHGLAGLAHHGAHVFKVNVDVAVLVDDFGNAAHGVFQHVVGVCEGLVLRHVIAQHIEQFVVEHHDQRIDVGF